MENFKIVESKYPLQVNRYGIVKNSITGNVLKLSINRKGYCQVGTTHKGIKITTTAHRLVALAFIPNPENKPEVNHIDGNKTNNHIDNLEWVTAKENTQHAILHNLHVNPAYRNGEQIESSKITEEMARKICKELEIKQTKKSISIKLNVSESIVNDISCGKTWKHVSKDYNILRKTNRRFSEYLVDNVCNLLSKGYSSAEIYKEFPEATSSLLYNLRNRLCYHDTYLKYFPLSEGSTTSHNDVASSEAKRGASLVDEDIVCSL